MTVRRHKVLVALIDSLALRRASMESMLKSAGSNLTVLAYPNIGTLVENWAAGDQLDLVLMYHDGPRNMGWALRDTLDTLAADLGPVPVVLLAEQMTAEEMVLAVRLGVRGVLPSTLEPAVAIQALWLVHVGGTFLPATAVMDHFDSHKSDGRDETWAKPKDESLGLTERELQVLSLIREGMPNKVIAHKLKLRIGTVKVYVRRLMRKLGVSNRTQAALLAKPRAAQVSENGGLQEH